MCMSKCMECVFGTYLCDWAMLCCLFGSLWLVFVQLTYTKKKHDSIKRAHISYYFNVNILPLGVINNYSCMFV